VNQRFEYETAAHIERADTLGRVEFVAGDRQEIDPEFIDAGRRLAHGLGGVGMQRNAVLARDDPDFRDRLDRADLVVRVHHADQDRLRRDGPADGIRVHAPGEVHRQLRNPGTETFEVPARTDNRRMLDLRRDDVTALLLSGEEHALEREIVGFASAAGEHDLVRRGAEERRNLTASCFQRRLRRHARPMAA
jgi:hypothetical protein